MGVLEEFRSWLRQWFSPEEVSAMTETRWVAEEGVQLRGRAVMNVEEFLWLAASFAAGKVLGERRVKVVPKLNEDYVLDLETRTVVAASALRNGYVDPRALEALLEDMVRQAEEARDHYMSLRALVA